MMQEGGIAEPRACPRWGVPQETLATCREGEDRYQPLGVVSQLWCVLAVGPALVVSFILCPLEGKASLSWTANYSHKEPFEDNGQLTVKDNEDRDDQASIHGERGL